jgi:hypothetical protein
VGASLTLAWIGVALAAVAAAVSYWHARIARAAAESATSASEEANRIQADILRLHKDAADEQAEAARQTKWAATVSNTPNRCVLTVACLRPADARDVSVLVNGEDARAYGRLFEEIEPIGHTELMQSGDQLRFACVRVDGMPTIRNVTISWGGLGGTAEHVSRVPRRAAGVEGGKWVVSGPDMLHL